MSELNEQEAPSKRYKPSAANKATRSMHERPAMERPWVPACLLPLAMAVFLVAGAAGAAHAQEGAAIDSSLFEHHYITTDLPSDQRWGYGTPALADFDNDDDLDFAFSTKKDTVYWFENQGEGQGAISWKRHALGTIPVRSLGGTALDVDQDGWTDLVVGGYWYRNPGTPRRAAFTRYRYDASIDTEIHDIVAADVNGDDRLEVVVTGDEEGAYWYATPDDPMRNADWPRHTITEAVTVENDSIHASFFPQGVADLDSDGDADAVMPDRWYENRAQGTQWVAHDLPFGKRGPWGLSSRSWVADMDQDGDADIVMTDADQKQSRAAWLENDGGDPPQFTRHALPQEAAGERGSFHSLAVADFDEDQDLDVFAVEQEDGAIFPAGVPPRGYVWENLDGKGQRFAERVVFDGRLGGHDALAGDVDGDGDMDIVSKVWTRWKGNANAGREHADLLENRVR